jgi:hypothetical protein
MRQLVLFLFATILLVAHSQDISFVSTAQDTPLCTPCQLGVSLVKEYINKPDEELLKMLLAGCGALPEQLVTPCKMAVTLVGGQMIAYIRSHLRESPREICARFKLCGPPSSEIVNLQDGPMCSPCQLAVSLIKDFIHRPEDELVEMMTKSCDSLPSDFQSPCKIGVMLVGKQAILFIRGQLTETPRQICSRFNACARDSLLSIKP